MHLHFRKDGDQKEVIYSLKKVKVQIEHLKPENSLKKSEVDACAAAVLRGGVYHSLINNNNLKISIRLKYRNVELSFW